MIKSLWAVLFFLNLPLIAHAENKIVRIGTGEWTPLTGEKLENGGPINDIAQKILVAAGYQPQFIFEPWITTITSLETGARDIASCAWRNKERDALFLTGKQAVLDGRLVFVKRKNDAWTFKGLPSLTGKKVGTLPGYGYGDLFMAATHFTRIESPTLEMTLKKLVSGEIDVTLENEAVINYFILKEKPELSHLVELDQTPLLRTPCYLMVSKKSPYAHQLIEDMDERLKQMKADKSYENLMRHHHLIQ